VLAGGVALAAAAAGVVLTVLWADGGGTNRAVGAPRRPSATSASSARARDSSSATPSPRPRPASTPRPQHDPFGSAAFALAKSRPGAIQAAVYDVATGHEWQLGPGRPQAEASVVKVDILETLLARYRSSDEVLPSADLPVAQQMIEFSDNDSATALWYAAGGPTRIASFNAAVGLRSTSMSPCVVCSGFPWPGWGLSTTTPADQITLLRELISPGSALTSGQRRYMLDLMEHVTPEQRWGVSGGVPAGVTVALKNGWLPLNSSSSDWQVNSVGWISGDGRDYLIAVLTTGNPTEQDGIGLVSQLAAMVWRNMDARSVR
jgi:hypothetical protein